MKMLFITQDLPYIQVKLKIEKCNSNVLSNPKGQQQLLNTIEAT